MRASARRTMRVRYWLRRGGREEDSRWLVGGGDAGRGCRSELVSPVSVGVVVVRFIANDRALQWSDQTARRRLRSQGNGKNSVPRTTPVLFRCALQKVPDASPPVTTVAGN